MSLGCGYDSTFFWLNNPEQLASYIEIDFKDVVQRKSKIILAHEEMAKMVAEDLQTGDSHMFSKVYKLLAQDVRDEELIKAQLEGQVDFSLPTLVITECLLIYMKKADSQGILEWVRDIFTGDLSTINFEMINPDDKFGQMMVENLENRGC